MNDELQKTNPTPRFIQIEPTNKCNLSCVMCPRQLMTRPPGFMPREQYKRIVMDASAMGIRILKLFFMGEPLLHPDIIEFVSYAKACDMKVLVQTNGILLTEEKARGLLDAGLDSLGVSIDGGWDYHKVRGDCYEEVFRNVLKFGIMKRKGGYNTHLRLTILNFGQDEALLSAFYQPLAAVVDSSGYIPLGKHVGISQLSPGGELKHVEALPGEDFQDCKDGREGLVVFWDGRATFCCGDYDGRGVVGDLTEQKLLDVIHSEKLKEKRDKLCAQEFDFEPCNTCVWARREEKRTL